MIKFKKHLLFREELLNELKEIKNIDEKKTLEGIISYGFSSITTLEVLIDEMASFFKIYMNDNKAKNICDKISSYKI